MAKIAVIHSEFHSGGAEAVCFSIIEAIQQKHEIDLFSLDNPNIEQNNAQFGTNIDNIEVYDHETEKRVFDKINNIANSLTDDWLGAQIALKSALHHRLLVSSGILSDYNLRVSTKNELPLGQPTIQYIHQPMFNRHLTEGQFKANGLGVQYQSLVSKIANADPQAISRSTLLTNSDWTATELAKIYDRPQVVYPPVNVEEFENPSWSDRENGFVMIGRISPDKYVNLGINIVESLCRRRGIDTHLHLIGPKDRNHPGYVREIEDRASDLSFVSVEGKLPREELVTMVESHKWGLHAKPREHFGIAVAELVAGGVVPFVPDSGGQTEIVGNDERLMFSDATEAVEKITNVVQGKSCREIRAALPDPSRYSKERFQDEIRSLVDDFLEQ